MLFDGRLSFCWMDIVEDDLFFYPVAMLIIAKKISAASESDSRRGFRGAGKFKESVLPRVGAVSLFALPVPSTSNR